MRDSTGADGTSGFPVYKSSIALFTRKSWFSLVILLMTMAPEQSINRSALLLAFYLHFILKNDTQLSKWLYVVCLYKTFEYHRFIIRSQRAAPFNAK